MDLDINTKKGQESLRHEKKMLEKIEHSFSVQLIETPKKMDSKIDGIIVKDDQISGIFESKCRDMSYMELLDYKSWLVTFNKIMDGKKISEMLRVPFFGFLYLIPDELVFYWKITDEFGEFRFGFNIKRTLTRKTINGGTAIRTNAYLPVKYANEIA